jgi:carbon monoxide dehydrogenase subunit G
MWHKFVGALLVIQMGMACGADDVALDVKRKGDSFIISATATLAAPASVVWEVLTDYDHLARFIPGLSRSAVKIRAANRLQVEQAGEARFFVFAYPIEMRLEVLESPHESITSRRIGGNLKRMTGRYDLQVAQTGVRLRYAGELEPDFALPPLIGTLAVRTMVEEQFVALVSEIERRAALAR